jgi:hypothetical protein
MNLNYKVTIGSFEEDGVWYPVTDDGQVTRWIRPCNTETEALALARELASEQVTKFQLIAKEYLKGKTC